MFIQRHSFECRPISNQTNEAHNMFKATMIYAGIIATIAYGALSSALAAIGA